MRRIVAAGLLALLAASWVTAPAAAAPGTTYTCGGHRATIVGTPRAEYLTGTPHDDVIVGRGGDDHIRGGGGNDVICGGAGRDFLYGGRGRDALYGGKDLLLVTDEGDELVGDQLHGGPGDDKLVGGYDVRKVDEAFPDVYAYDTAAHPIHADLAKGTVIGAGHDRVDPTGVVVLGSRYDDVLAGGPGDDRLNGNGGSDVLRGRGGDDILVGDGVGSQGKHRNDRLYGGPGRDDLDTNVGEDALYGGPGDDSVHDTGKSADLEYGGSGDDLLIGELWDSSSPQVFDGGTGNDRLSVLTSQINPAPLVPAHGTWDMATGTMTYHQAHLVQITARNFETGDFAAWGSSWTIQGTNNDDDVNAGGTWGTTFYGLAGNDTFMGSTHADLFDGGDGFDTSESMGYDPDDTCISVESFAVSDCDHIS